MSRELEQVLKRKEWKFVVNVFSYIKTKTPEQSGWELGVKTAKAIGTSRASVFKIKTLGVKDKILFNDES